jgi:hypothetical protein
MQLKRFSIESAAAAAAAAAAQCYTKFFIS